MVAAAGDVRIRKPLLWYEAVVFLSLAAGFLSFPPDWTYSSGGAYILDTLGASLFFFVVQLIIVLPAITFVACLRLLDWAAWGRHPALRGLLAILLSPLPAIVWWLALQERLKTYDLSEPGTGPFAFVAIATSVAAAVIFFLHRPRAEQEPMSPPSAGPE